MLWTTEVIIAGKGDDKKETIYEIADLAYHVLVLMIEMGISTKDIFDELAENFGNAEEALLVRTVNDSAGTAYAVTLLGALLNSQTRENRNISCNVNKSDDGKNHIWILRKKS